LQALAHTKLMSSVDTQFCDWHCESPLHTLPFTNALPTVPVVAPEPMVLPLASPALTVLLLVPEMLMETLPEVAPLTVPVVPAPPLTPELLAEPAVPWMLPVLSLVPLTRPPHAEAGTAMTSARLAANPRYIPN
jgi:hypothetical protein